MPNSGIEASAGASLAGTCEHVAVAPGCYERTWMAHGERGWLTGVLSLPASDRPQRDLALLIQVGGPQNRMGSHRQFVLLARQLAALGYPVLRFDVGGMGDAERPEQAFFDAHLDLSTALEGLRQVAQVQRVVVWGLCDGASGLACWLAYLGQQARSQGASALRAQASLAAIAGAIWVNPWVHTEAGQAQTQLKHYYLQRLMRPEFWKKLLGGGVDAGTAVREVLGHVKTLVRRRFASREAGGQAAVARWQCTEQNYVARMLEGLAVGVFPYLFVLSSDDLVAREFDELCQADPNWQKLVASKGVITRIAANHTFASAQQRHDLGLVCAEFLGRL